MCADIEQLTRGVARVSLRCTSQEKPLRNESLSELVQDKALRNGHSDVDMSESPSRLPTQEETEQESTEDESSSYPQNEAYHESYENDPSTKSSEMSPLNLRRSGKSSLGLSKDFCEIIYVVLLSVAYLGVSKTLSNSGTAAKILRDIGSLNLVCVSVFQVVSIFKLLRDLFCLGCTNRAGSKVTAPSKRSAISRDRRREGRWNLSAADKVDNRACKVLVLFSLIVTRVCVVLLCNFLLGFVTADYEGLIETGYEKLNTMLSFVDSVTYGGIFNPNLHANVLQECKTVPELVFESRYMCT